MGVSHCGLAIYIKKYLKAKEELCKFKYFTMQKYNLKKNQTKETKTLQDIITLELISSFNTSQNIILKNPHIKIDLLPWGQKSLKLLYSIMNLNTVGTANKNLPNIILFRRFTCPPPLCCHF